MGMEGDYRWDERNNMSKLERRVGYETRQEMNKPFPVSGSELYDDYFSRCDLCDELNFPQVNWCCVHDDPAHVTSICIKCLKILYEKYGGNDG